MSRHIIDGLTVTGQVGQTITALDRALCIAQATHEASGPAFTDRSAEARTEGGTAFALLAATTDRFYFGYDSKFPGIRVDLDVAGAGLALVWEYWNGSAWTALSGVAGAASGLTADGAATWTKPGDWAKTTVNAGASLYFVRVRTTTHTTTPTAFFTVVNWTIFDDAAGTNAKVYKSIGEDGVSAILLWVGDNGATAANYSNFRLYETWDAGPHTGTNPAPTIGQAANGATWRKSNTADATARPTIFGVSRDRVVACAYDTVTVIAAGTEAQTIFAGKFKSYVTADAFGQGIFTNATGATQSSCVDRSTTAMTVLGNYLLRPYTGSVGAVQSGPLGMCIPVTTTDWPVYPNGPDGALLSGPWVFFEGASASTRHVRGEYEGFLAIYHNRAGTLANLDTFTHALSGKKYHVAAASLANGVVAANFGAPWLGIEYDP